MHFVRNRIYFHKVIRFNYTTYDLRRDQDTVNPRTHADVIVLSDEDGKEDPHPYWYARVVGIFHVFVQIFDTHTSRLGQQMRMDVLQVRWFGRCDNIKAGWAVKRLYQVAFLPLDHIDTFGFLDPEQVVRGSHLIPRFACGQTADLLGPSDIRQPSEGNLDWIYYYVNM